MVCEVAWVDGRWAVWRRRIGRESLSVRVARVRSILFWGVDVIAFDDVDEGDCGRG